MDIVGALLTFLAVVLAPGVLLLAIYTAYIAHIRSKYSHLPCPQPVSFFLGHVSALKKYSDEHGNFITILSKWAKEYGSTYVLFMLHKAFVVTCNPDSIKDLLVNGNFSKSKKYSDLASVFGQRILGKGLVTELNHGKWSARRNVLNPAFHRSVLKKLMTEFNTISNQLVEKLGSHADNEDTIEIAHYFNRATLDVLGKVGFGKDLESIHKEDSPFSKAIFDLAFLIYEDLRDPLLSIPFRGREHKARMKEVVTYLRKTAQEWIEERCAAVKRGDYVPDDLLTCIIKLKDILEDGDEEVLLDDVITFFIAGQETTANTVSFMLMEMGRHPEVLKRLYAEVDDIIGQKPHISFEDVTKLEYMSMVWKETLRLYAVAPSTLRDVDRKGYKIEGYDIPQNTMILLSSFICSRNPAYVNDPLTFNPERFAPDSKDRPDIYSYFPFSLGPRSCIGQTFAKMEGVVLITKFLQNFNYELDPNQSFNIQENLTLKPRGGVKAKISWRKTV